jgi:hypothetical protein
VLERGANSRQTGQPLDGAFAGVHDIRACVRHPRPQGAPARRVDPAHGQRPLEVVLAAARRGGEAARLPSSAVVQDLVRVAGVRLQPGQPGVVRDDLLSALGVDVGARLGRQRAPERPVLEAKPKARPAHLHRRCPGDHHLAARVAPEL